MSTEKYHEGMLRADASGGQPDDWRGRLEQQGLAPDGLPLDRERAWERLSGRLENGGMGSRRGMLPGWVDSVRSRGNLRWWVAAACLFGMVIAGGVWLAADRKVPVVPGAGGELRGAKQTQAGVRSGDGEWRARASAVTERRTERVQAEIPVNRVKVNKEPRLSDVSAKHMRLEAQTEDNIKTTELLKDSLAVVAAPEIMAGVQAGRRQLPVVSLYELDADSGKSRNNHNFFKLKLYNPGHFDQPAMATEKQERPQLRILLTPQN